jgi:hypothetical protein
LWTEGLFLAVAIKFAAVRESFVSESDGFDLLSKTRFTIAGSRAASNIATNIESFNSKFNSALINFNKEFVILISVKLDYFIKVFTAAFLSVGSSSRWSFKSHIGSLLL